MRQSGSYNALGWRFGSVNRIYIGFALTYYTGATENNAKTAHQTERRDICGNIPLVTRASLVV